MSAYRSTHGTDRKGKGIAYDDDDDAPIRLEDREGSFVIKEFNLTLIGKILNPKKQSVEKLLQTMPSQWGLSDKIIANDIGNGKFLFNFSTEEDLKYVLRQGPFHYNFCMFVLVRWEPIVHDDYPWIIPFWVQLVGFPLHLWTDANLRNIGGRLGHVDTLELTEGRMLIDIDSRKPLKFSRKVEYKGDEVTIEIKYTLLFKHCTTCGLLSHEKGYCPTNDVKSRLQVVDRPDVFARMQLPERLQDVPPPNRQFSQLSLNSELTSGHNKVSNKHSYHQSSLVARDTQSRRVETNFRGRMNQERSSYHQSRDDNKRWGHHSDRIIRRKDEPSRYNRYGGARAFSGPYDRRTERMWREKQSVVEIDRDKRTMVENGRDNRRLLGDADSSNLIMDKAMASFVAKQRHESVPYEHDSSEAGDSSPVAKKNETASARKLASAIVTLSRQDHPMEDNVTIRQRGESLKFSLSSAEELMNNDEQIIGALDDMEVLEQQDGEMMEAEPDEDDLLGADLMEMEASKDKDMVQVRKNTKIGTKPMKNKRHSNKKSAPLGIPSRKFDIIRRGSPSRRIAPSELQALGGNGKARRHTSGAKRTHEGSSKHDGLMGSKYPSKNH